MTDNKFSFFKIKDFLDQLGIQNNSLDKQDNITNKDKEKEKEEENERESFKEEIKDKLKSIKPKEDTVEEKEKSEKTENSEKSEKEEIKEEQKEEQFAKPSSFNQDEIES